MPKVVPEYKHEARSRILAAARTVFAEKGYHQATMDDVAKKLGVSKGALYLYFASKEELFEAMSRTETEAFRGILYLSFSSQAGPFENANKFFDKMLEQYGTNPGLSFEILSEASHNPALKKILKKNQEEYAEVTAKFLEEGRKLSFVRDDLDFKALSHGLVALWNGIETALVAGLSEADARRAWQETIRAIFEPGHKKTAPLQSSRPSKTA